MTLDENEIRFRLKRLADEMEVEPDLQAITGNPIPRIRAGSKARRSLALGLAASVAIAAGATAIVALNQESVSVVVQQSPRSESDIETTTAKNEEGILIDTDVVDRTGGRANLILGRVRLDEKRNCLYLELESGERYHAIFPGGSTLAYEPLRILDRAGGIFAVIDEPADFGGSIADPRPVISSDNACGADQSIYVWNTRS